MSASLALLDAVLGAPAPSPCEDVGAWVSAHRARIAEAASPWDAAVRGGVAADRVGYAFAGGYQAALWALVPMRDRGRMAALCATEPGGAHPRAIATTIESGVLRGEKTFVTLGSQAEDLYVLAREGSSERAPLVLARVERDAPGLAWTVFPPMPFVPEIPHASVLLQDVRAFEVLPGDGWADYVKPFRTVEDVHVHGALLAWLGASALRHGFERATVERILALLTTFTALSAADPSSPSTHIALGGALALARALVDELDAQWERAPEDERARWRRDRKLLDVAGKARALRLERAWERLGRDTEE